jgi:hypothetical protein
MTTLSFLIKNKLPGGNSVKSKVCARNRQPDGLVRSKYNQTASRQSNILFQKLQIGLITEFLASAVLRSLHRGVNQNITLGIAVVFSTWMGKDERYGLW